MNYLAHAYLSFNNPHIIVGNMISDYVKGKKQFEYPPTIQLGIQLHRAIDEFTDSHSVTQEMKKYFRHDYRLYSGAFVDVVYDYFLANDKNEFDSAESLRLFSQNTYQVLENQQDNFPEKFSKMFPYMQSQDWLFNYRTDEGMQKSFAGLARRAKYITETDKAFDIFLCNKEDLRNWYQFFFPSLKSFAIQKSELLLKK